MERIALTITSCKRYNLLLKTVTSFHKHCIDRNIISDIIFYDDSSEFSDRIKMSSDMMSIFPNTNIEFKFFHKNSFKTNKRHMEIMKIWKEDIKKYDYVFHLEDDWEFIEDFCLKDAIDIMKNEKDYAMIGFSWKEKKYPKDFYIPRKIKEYWEWYYSDKHDLLESLFIDEVEMELLPEDEWVNYINWPYFGFRPAIHDVKKISKLETFNDSMDSFELEFAIRYSKLYKSLLHVKRICYHIGDESSSYNLNKSVR